MPDAAPSGRNAVDLMSEIEDVYDGFVAVLEMLDAAGENKLTASNVHRVLFPLGRQLRSSTDALNRLLGR
jgi:hypothetical protein